ncbi:MAG: RES domain-containing protein [bacterium]|nr:RES domain-containing protein [bacterium]
MPLDVQAVAIRGPWFRHSRSGIDPCPHRDPAPDNRWQRGALVDALYLADKTETAWAEWYRHLAELGIPPDQRLPVDLWTWQVDVEVANLSTEKRLRKVGLPRPTPGRHTWLPFQEIGEELQSDGWSGLIAPSAARPSGLVLCLFRAADPIPNAIPQPSPRTITAPPVLPRGMTT